MAAKVDLGSNVFQRHLIPPDSLNVRFVMQKAGEYGNSTNIFYAHVVSVGFAIVAVALSFFNAFSYALRTPFNILVNVLSFSPIQVVKDLAGDLTGVAKSMVFVSLGVTFVVAGVLFPQAIFTHFAPEYSDTVEVRLRNELEKERKEKQELKTENKHLKDQIEDQSIIIQQVGKKKNFYFF